MNFLRSYFFKNEPLISCLFLLSKLDPVIKTTNFDERNGQLIRGSFLKK